MDAASLEKPTAEVVRHIYEGLVSTFLGVTRYISIHAWETSHSIKH